MTSYSFVTIKSIEFCYIQLIIGWKLKEAAQGWKTRFIVFLEKSSLLWAWNYNIRRNVNSDLSIVTMRIVAITF